MNPTIELLNTRKSMRVFENEPIPEKDVRAILNASLQAPTAGNMTLWTAIRVTDEKKKHQLSVTCDNQPFIASAPLVIVFCADYKRWYDLFKTLKLDEPLRKPDMGDFLLAMVDTVIAAHASVVAADSLGYGSCYIGDIIENEEKQLEILGLPEYVKPICLVVYGRPTVQQMQRKKPARFRLDDVVCENMYAAKTPMKDMLEIRQDLHDEMLEQWLTAFCRRKWNCPFSEEMSRSARKILDDWKAGR